MDKKVFTPTPKQQEVIGFVNGYALVLAPPGCGKTEVLSARIIKAHQEYGVPYSEMLCLTFTNRAAREMQDRIKECIAEPTDGLFVGNLHRFCIRFLAENEIIKLDTSIIDDDDQLELIADLGNFDMSDQWLSYKVNTVVKVASVMQRKQLGFPADLINPGNVCQEWDYRKNSALAQRYLQYKKDNNLIDFDDILHLAFAEMQKPDFKDLKYSDYQWLQVDEVQDLNPLQLAIIDKLTSKHNPTVIFLGDERQAIFSFLGATNMDLDKMKATMKVFRFDTNYRSPKYLVDFINHYASANFGIPLSSMPNASNDIPNDNGLVLLGVNDYYDKEQASLIAAQTRQIFFGAPNDSVGILARVNRDVDNISSLLDSHGIKHLKLSKNDMFKMVDFKTVYSHFAVVANEHRSSEWSRILYQTKVIERIADARAFTSRLKTLGLSVTDFMREDGLSYICDFVQTFDQQEFVIFDIETTGLNVFEDDVIQIAAVKMNAHGIVPNSEFDIIIRTDREIPKTLANGYKNPMIEVYQKAQKYSFDYAIEKFLDYVGDDMVLGHNATYDVNILLNNIRRRTDIPESTVKCFNNYWDSLKLARLIDPNIRSHKLATLLRYYGLPGVNSHNAIDDVKATCNLVALCFEKAKAFVPKQMTAMMSKEFKRVTQRLIGRYKSYYYHTLDKLYTPIISEENTLVSELEWVYDNFVLDKFIKRIDRFGYIKDLFKKVLTKDNEPYFALQVLNHIYEMRTFNESDLYQNNVVKENIHIMTIHKAKGLQFDNVFVYGLEGFPSYQDQKHNQTAEAARVLYVAISRAKRRLYLCYNRECSRFINERLKSMCHILSREQIDRILQLEDVFKIAKT